MSATMILTNGIPSRMTGSSLFSSPWEGWERPGLVGQRREHAPSINLIEYIRPVGSEKSSCQLLSVFQSGLETGFTPKTELGRRLYALRTKAVVAGMKLLSEDEVLAEVKRRRGEIENDETDLY